MSGKTCTVCKEVKPVSAFGKHRNQCRGCRYKIDYARNSVNINRKNEERRILKTYGITKDEYDQRRQDSKLCPICDEPCPDNLDHKDGTTQVRDFLCGSCNRGLGMFKHNTEFLSKAIKYLDKWELVHNGF